MRTDFYLFIVGVFSAILLMFFLAIEAALPRDVYFFLGIATTVLITRIVLYIKPVGSPSIRDFEMHHYMYGLMLIPVGMLLKNLPLYTIGFGLFIDELTFFLMRGKNHDDYYSRKSILGTVFFVLMAYFFRNRLLMGL